MVFSKIRLGLYAGNEYVRPYIGYPRISRSGSRFHSKLGEGSQETIKRGGPGGGGAGMWFGPHSNSGEGSQEIIKRGGPGGGGAGMWFGPHSKLSEVSQETIKRGGPGGGTGMWFGPRLGRMQKRSPAKEHVWI